MSRKAVIGLTASASVALFGVVGLFVAQSVRSQTSAEPRTSAAPASTPRSREPSAPIHRVRVGDSLWTIAVKHDPKNPHALIDRIVQANSDKLKSRKTRLAIGWELVIPIVGDSATVP